MVLSTNPQVGIGAYIPPTGGSGGPSDVLTQGNDSVSFPNSVQLVAGTNVTLTPASSPNTLTISSSGGTASPGGTNGQLQYNAAGALGGFTANGGATINTTTGVVTLGNPGASTLGGIESLAAVTSKWINTISTSGVPSATQPAFSDISGSATLAQFPTEANNTVLGNVSGGTAVPVALTATQLTTIPNVFTSSLQGMVPASGGGTTNFLRADGTFTAPGGSGTVTTTGSPASGNLTKFSGATSITNGDLSGDITTSGTLAATLATVNSNVGSFTNANITVNGKGLITAAANGSGGGVSSITGDSVLISNSGSTGAVTLTQANAAAYTLFQNNTGSSATPTFGYGDIGFQIVTTNTTLTANSPSYNVVNAAGSVTFTLPTCASSLGKVFWFQRIGSLNTITINCNAADTFQDTGNTSYPVSSSVAGANTFLVGVRSDGVNTWRPVSRAVAPASDGGTGASLNFLSTGLIPFVNATGSTSAFGVTAQGTSGQLFQSAGSGTPTWTSTPGSGTTLTSITATHQIAGGTAPTVAVGAGAGSGGSPGATIAGHDTDFAVTLTMGTTTGTGVIFTVTFGTAYASAPYVQVTPASAATAALVGGITQWYPTSTTTTMVLNSGTTGLTAAGAVYIFNVHCGQ